jgi:NTP pyrophosphatase (non-canonical NTP hydrolase)
MTYEQLEERILEWADARGILKNGKSNSQLLKAISEIGELADAHAKNQPEEIKDAIGDIVVCLINYCALQDIKLLDCLDGAYNVIKDRNGYLTKDGVFIKGNYR